MLSGAVITENEAETVMNRINDNKESEQNMLEHIKRAKEKTEEPVIRTLLGQLLSDETKHHKSLEAIAVKKTYKVGHMGYMDVIPLLWLRVENAGINFASYEPLEQQLFSTQR